MSIPKELGLESGAQRFQSPISPRSPHSQSPKLYSHKCSGDFLTWHNMLKNRSRTAENHQSRQRRRCPKRVQSLVFLMLTLIQVRSLTLGLPLAIEFSSTTDRNVDRLKTIEKISSQSERYTYSAKTCFPIETFLSQIAYLGFKMYRSLLKQTKTPNII
jgi:hypothetical protein